MKKDKIYMGNTGIRKTKKNASSFFITSAIAYVLLLFFGYYIIEGLGFLRFWKICVLLGTALYVFLMLGMYRDRQRKTVDAEGVEHGSASFAEEKDYEKAWMEISDPIMEPTKDGSCNIPYTKNLSISLKKSGNVNSLVFGGTGSGKTFRVVMAQLLQKNASVVIVDPASDLLKKTGRMFLRAGYDVKVFNLNKKEYSDTYNPLAYIQKTEDIQTITRIIMSNSITEDAKPEPFFEEAGAACIASVIWLLWKRYPESATLPNVVRLINTAEAQTSDGIPSVLDRLFEKERLRDPHGFGYEEYRNWNKGSGNTVNSVIATAAGRLNLFLIPEIKNMVSTDTINLNDFGKKRRILYLCIPTADTTFNSLTAMFYSQLFDTMYRNAEKNESWCVYEKETIKHYKTVDELKFGLHKHLRIRKDEALDEISWFRRKYNMNQIPFLKIPMQTTERRGRFLAMRDSEAEIREYADKIKKAQILPLNGRPYGIREKERQPYGLVYISPEGKDEVLEVFNTFEAQNNIKLAKEWQAKFDHIEIEKTMETSMPEPTRFIIDEAYNVGDIPNIINRLSTCRKYNISVMLIYQDLSQLKTQHKDDWESVFANSETRIVLATQDSTTAEYVKKLCGEGTIGTKSDSLKMGSDKGGGNSSTYSSSGRAIVEENELLLMKEDECIVIQKGFRPFNDKKLFPPTDFKEAWKEIGDLGHPDERVFAIENYRRPLSEKMMERKQEELEKKIEMFEAMRAKELQEMQELRKQMMNGRANAGAGSGAKRGISVVNPQMNASKPDERRGKSEDPKKKR